MKTYDDVMKEAEAFGSEGEREKPLRMKIEMLWSVAKALEDNTWTKETVAILVLMTEIEKLHNSLKEKR